MKERGQLIIMSGFSGSGKGTITQELIRRYPEEYALSVSATTRKPREGETDGVHYFFLSREAFEEKINRGEFLEYACYVGNYYGTPADYVEAQRDAGKNVLLEIEIQGAMQVREKHPDTLLVFVTPPSIAILEDRLRGRGTETDEVINARLSQAVKEAEGCEAYDYLIINDDLEDSIEAMHQIAGRRENRMDNNLPWIRQLKEELYRRVKGDQNS